MGDVNQGAADSFENRFLSGGELYGDDFGPREIEAWYADEKEGYADLVRSDEPAGGYAYHALNAYHGFSALPNGRFRHALGLGSFDGAEFQPILDRIERVTILEPSDAYRPDHMGAVPVSYVHPSPSGDMPFAEGAFDLVTCLGVLHHIPNVGHVLREMARCTEPGGYALVREPTESMGDWRARRAGLTKRERGIPIAMFRRLIAEAGFQVVRERAIMFTTTVRLAAKGVPVYATPGWVRLDAALARMFAMNRVYHHRSGPKKLRPTNAYFVLERR